MTLLELDEYFNSFLQKENYSDDISLNGIQIQNSMPDKKEIKKIAFAVDACEATALKAAEQKADVLFVHHGLFWGRCETITGQFYRRINAFLKNDLALIAYHIPLDANNPYGNNYGMAQRINLTNLEPFGQWHGMNIGVKGTLNEPLTTDEIAQKILRPGKKANHIIKAGKEKNKTVGIISGGASEEIKFAVEQNLDCYITGEFLHEDFQTAKEMNINVISGGHYETETVGVNLLMNKIQTELGIQAFFIEEPSGL
ncbi:MAG: Nif3-like dinuclear metal center hexameric protein [Treponema sp.]|nr:Nif3-like dinuclear metal center hexameric protein [Treponema sp.]